VHYLVSRFGGADRARAAARLMLIDTGRESQLPFAATGPYRNHRDALVHQAQSLIEQGGIDGRVVDLTARSAGVSVRTLSRRFQGAIGLGPKAYVGVVRVERAKRLLEETGKTVDEIRRELGVADATTFGRAFKRTVGATPTEYRRRFGNGRNSPPGR
jgi:transcriptional regulator GlxA family with amidase domain